MESLEFAGLDPEQNSFLAHRLRHQSDTAAAAAAGIRIGRVEGWKTRDTAFMEAYRGLRADGVKLAHRITREDLGLAALALREGLSATRVVVVTRKDVRVVPDWTARREAAELIFRIHGVLRDRVDMTVVVQEAQRIADRLGIDASAVIAEAEAIVASGAVR